MKEKKTRKNSSKMKVTVIKGPQFEERKKEAYRLIGEIIRRELAKEQANKKR
jgi:hypothetical protein